MFPRYITFFLVLLIFHLLFFAYPVIRICDWLGLECHADFDCYFLPFFFSQVISRIIVQKSLKTFFGLDIRQIFFSV